ncbi:hypothetical protein [Pigmentibacter ruber]|uniref:hypothetical protein n=1 Tax=Pigmentibacter ruber TaxID=2683196 RepID=UPI00131E9232|nr:hypothetical protein [Pigmentibacter ruber]
MKICINKMVVFIFLQIIVSCGKVNKKDTNKNSNSTNVSLSFQNQVSNRNEYNLLIEGTSSPSCNPYSSERSWKLGMGEYTALSNLIIKNYDECDLSLSKITLKDKIKNIEYKTEFKDNKSISKFFQEIDSFRITAKNNEELFININLSSESQKKIPKINVIVRNTMVYNLEIKSTELDNKLKAVGNNGTYNYLGNIKIKADENIKEYFLYKSREEDEDLLIDELNERYRNTNFQVNKKILNSPKKSVTIFADYFIESNILPLSYPQNGQPSRYVNEALGKYKLILLTTSNKYISYDLL